MSSHLPITAAQITYEDITTNAIVGFMKALGFDVKPERVWLRGEGHWGVRLTPEMRRAIRKHGLPILGVLAFAPSVAEAQGEDGSQASPYLSALGGVAMAESASTDFLLGWTAIDAQVPQVFLTLVSAAGAKKQLKMLTRAPGEKSDAALARLNDGWAVGWVDERHQDPEIYAVKVGNDLNPAAPEQRITDSPGGASDLALLALDDRVLMAWGDTRARARLSWHRSARYEAANDGAAANLPQFQTAYVPTELADDPALAAACDDTSPTDPAPDVPNCPIPFGFFFSAFGFGFSLLISFYFGFFRFNGCCFFFFGLFRIVFDQTSHGIGRLGTNADPVLNTVVF
jgi:hypothetical protein